MVANIKLYDEWCATGSLDSSFAQLKEAESDKSSGFTFDITLGDVLHFTGDLAAIAADFWVPGSGSVLDALHTMAYLIEGHLAKDPNEKIKCWLAAIVQLVSIFAIGPLQAGTMAVKSALSTVFGFFSRRVLTIGQVIATRRAAASAHAFFKAILNGFTELVELILKGISDATFKPCIEFLEVKLGGKTAYEFIKRILTEEIPGQIKYTLEVLARFNPEGVGAGQVEDEINQFLIKSAGKVLIEGNIVDKIIDKVSGYAVSFSEWVSSKEGITAIKYMIFPALHVVDFIFKAKEFLASLMPVGKNANAVKSNDSNNLKKFVNTNTVGNSTSSLLVQLKGIPGAKTAKRYTDSVAKPTEPNAVGIWISEYNRKYYFDCSNYEVDVYNVKTDDMGEKRTSDTSIAYTGRFKIDGDKIIIDGLTRSRASISEEMNFAGKIIKSNLPASK